jgi:hypothetical protein
MTSLFGGKNQVNNTTPPATSLRIQTSVAGKAIALICGQARLAGNLIDAQDFASYQVSTGGGGGGGKGLGGSCVAGETMIAAPGGAKRIDGIKPGDVIWSLDPASGARVTAKVMHVLKHAMADAPERMLRVTFSGRAETLHITSNHYPWIDGIERREMKDWQPGEALLHWSGQRAAIAGIVEMPKPAFTWNLVVEPHHNFFTEGLLLHNGFGGGGGKGSNQTNYRVAPVIGICEGPVAAFVQVWDGATAEALGTLNLTGFAGGYPNGVWGYMETNHPGNALGYPGLAYAAAGPMELGTSPDMKNLTWEMIGALNTAIAGSPDADPSAWVNYLLTDPNVGVGFPAARLGDLSTYQRFCRATGMVVSEALTDQRALNDYLNSLLEGTYSEFVFVDGALTIIPRGAQPVSGGGAAYTPPAIDYTLAIDDFLPNTNATGTSSASSALNNDPVIWSVKRRSDLSNQITVAYNDRANAYNPATQPAQDLAAIEAYGLRDTAKQYSFFALGGAALTAAHFQLELAQIDKTCCFTLGMKYARVMPMSLLAGVPLPANAGTTTVRVTEITQNQDFTFSITAEELPGAAVAPAQYNSENPNPNAPGINIDPGPVNAPMLFAAPIALAKNQGLEIWALASGSNAALYGGCDIYGASAAAGPYQYLTTLKSASRMGVTAADFPAGSDPDTIDTLNVDLSMSAGILEGGTASDADQANTLCLVRGAHGDEFVSYESATLTGSNRYALGTYLRRGLSNTAIVDHPVGSPFGRIDNAVAAIPYEAARIGQTLWLKFLAFNKFGGGGEELGAAEVVAYPVVLPAPPAPPDVANFAVNQSGNVVAFAWDAVSYPAVALAGYLIGYSAQGTTDWSEFILLTEAAAGTEMTNAEVPPGSWTFGIRAASIAYVPGSGSSNGLSPDIATADLTVQHVNPVIYDTPEGPAWPGDL